MTALSTPSSFSFTDYFRRAAPKLCAVGTCMAILLTQMSNARAEVQEQTALNVGQVERTLRAFYADGTSEQYVIRYVGTLERFKEQTGDAAMPLKLKIIDSRQCHWRLTGAVQRSMYVVHRSGKQLPYDAALVASLPMANKGSDLLVTRMRSENCNDASARYASDVADSVRKVTDVLNGAIQSDLPGVVALLRANAKRVVIER